MNAFEGIYDSSLAYALYQEYESGNESVLNELICQICPLVRKTYNYEIRADIDTREILECDALEEVLRIISDKSATFDHENFFTRYLMTVITRSFMDSISENQSEVFDFGSVCFYPRANLNFFRSIEVEIYRDQLIDFVRSESKFKVRFLGKERQACYSIIDSMLSYRKADIALIRRMYSIGSIRAKFLVNYSAILVKSILWDLNARENKDSSFSAQWETNRDILRAFS